MGEDADNQFIRTMREDPQFVPPALTLIFASFLYYSDPILGMGLDDSTEHTYVMVSVIFIAGLFVERFINWVFEMFRHRSSFGSLEHPEMIVKSAILFMFAIFAYNRPTIEGAYSATIVFLGFSYAFHKMSIQENKLIVEALFVGMTIGCTAIAMILLFMATISFI